MPVSSANRPAPGSNARQGQPLLPYLLLAVLTAVLMVPALLGRPMTHDSFWIDQNWSLQFTEALRNGRLYPRWLPQSFGGLGSPTFYFYAPLSFYLSGLFGLAGLSVYAALLATFAAAWFASGVTMYAWLKGRTRAPLAGAALYMVLPYHIMDFYARGAMAEFCAFALLPLIALGLEYATERRRPALLAFTYAALIMTHLPTSLLVSILLIAPLGIWTARTDRQRLTSLAIGIGGGVAIAAVYLLPALFLQRFSSVGALWGVKFLQPMSWSVLHPELWTSTSYVLLFAGLAVFTGLAAALASFRQWGFWTVWTVAICAIVTGLVPLFWSLPIVKAVQFPWRALSLAEFGLATLVARSRNSPVMTTATLLPLLAFAKLMANPANPMNGEPLQPLPIPGLQDVMEYLPPGAVGPGRQPRTDMIEAAVAQARAHPGSAFRFPSLVAECADGTIVQPEMSASRPLLAAPPPGCRLVTRPLPIERIGAAISVAGLLFFAIAGQLGRSKRYLAKSGEDLTETAPT